MAWRGPRSGTSPTYRTPTHRRARTALIHAYQPGDPCCLCGHPMWPPTSALHADHCPHCQGQGCPACAGTGYRGLAHGTQPCQMCGIRCNVYDGAARGRARKAARRAGRVGQSPLTW